MKIISLKTSLIRILKAASFRNKYDLFSNEISGKIFKIIKDKLSSKTNFKDSFHEKEEESKEEYAVDFYVKFSDTYDNKVDIKAKFYYSDQQTEPFIEIRIYLRTDFSENDFERFHWYLYECVRHEYEHFDKYIRGFWPDKRYDEIIESLNTINLSDTEKAKLISELLLHYIEIDSYAKSIMYVAKKRKIPYGYVIRDILNRLFFNNDKNIKKRMLQNQEVSQIIDEIKNRLIERIRKIFPASVLRDPF